MKINKTNAVILLLAVIAVLLAILTITVLIKVGGIFTLLLLVLAVAVIFNKISDNIKNKIDFNLFRNKSDAS